MNSRARRQDVRRSAQYAAARDHSPNQNSTPKPPNPKRKGSSKRTPFTVVTDPDGCTISTDLGLPSREMYSQLEDDYIKSLSVRKKAKALLTQTMFDHIWDVLHDPDSVCVGTPQFRWWVRKMFVLAQAAPDGTDADLKPVVMHEDRPVVVKEQIYDVLSYCHLLANHGGRDRTTAVVREHYSWVPKELIARFVKTCPTCKFKKTGTIEVSTPNRPPPSQVPGPTGKDSLKVSSTPTARSSVFFDAYVSDRAAATPPYVPAYAGSVAPALRSSEDSSGPLRASGSLTNYAERNIAQGYYDAVGWLRTGSSQPVFDIGSRQELAYPDDSSRDAIDGLLSLSTSGDLKSRLLAIDPALLSEEANASQLRLVKENAA